MSNKLKKYIDSFKNNWQQFINEGKECIKEFKNPKTRYKQIPNLFTASRLFAPFFIIPAALTGNLVLTGIFVAGFALTDAVDGFLAHTYNLESEFGRKLDALTDKLFAGSLLIPLIFIANPSLSILLFMEAAISAVNVYAQLSYNNPQTEKIGKVKTGALSVTILFNYISMMANIPSSMINALTVATLGLQIVSLTKYYDINSAKELEKKSELNMQLTIPEKTDEDEEKVKELEMAPASQDLDTTKQIDLTVEERIKQLQEMREQMVSTEDLNEEPKQKTMGSQK